MFHADLIHLNWGITKIRLLYFFFFFLRTAQIHFSFHSRWRLIADCQLIFWPFFDLFFNDFVHLRLFWMFRLKLVSYSFLKAIISLSQQHFFLFLRQIPLFIHYRLHNFTTLKQLFQHQQIFLYIPSKHSPLQTLRNTHNLRKECWKYLLPILIRIINCPQNNPRLQDFRRC